MIRGLFFAYIKHKTSSVSFGGSWEKSLIDSIGLQPVKQNSGDMKA